jgi:hypothetical protein
MAKLSSRFLQNLPSPPPPKIIICFSSGIQELNLMGEHFLMYLEGTLSLLLLPLPPKEEGFSSTYNKIHDIRNP